MGGRDPSKERESDREREGGWRGANANRNRDRRRSAIGCTISDTDSAQGGKRGEGGGVLANRR